jgi:hypothetical protein
MLAALFLPVSLARRAGSPLPVLHVGASTRNALPPVLLLRPMHRSYVLVPLLPVWFRNGRMHGGLGVADETVPLDRYAWVQWRP